MKLNAATRLAASYHADERGTYASVVPVKESRDTLHDLVRKYVYEGDQVGMWDLHATVVWSSAAIKPDQQYALGRRIDVTTVFHAYPKEATVWEGHDKEHYLVLLLNSDDLIRANAQLQSYGLPPANFDYSPHITLAKRVSPDFKLDDLNRALAQITVLSLSGFRLEDAK